MPKAQRGDRTITAKQKTFVAEYIANGKNATQAALKAYPNQTYGSAAVQGNENLQKPNVQQAIDEALAKSELTPEFAVNKIGNISSMEVNSKSAPSILKASTTILELHGWRKDDRPTMQLSIKNAFFNSSRRKTIDNNLDNSK